jgi:hypothetical protein
MIRRYRSPRSKVMGSTGVLGSLLGAFVSGQIMIWLGFFRPGQTPNEQILNYWPGFLVGAAVGGVICAILAFGAYSVIQGD